MKALLLSTRNVGIQDQRFLTGFRQRIGTCEFYSLLGEQQNNIRQFFSSFVRLSQFDRIVLEFSQALINKESMFLRQLPHLAMLSIGSDKLEKAELRLLKRNLHVMPWIRVISDNHQLVRQLLNDGYDAAWLRPMYNPDFYYSGRHKRETPRCVVFGKTDDILAARTQYYPQIQLEICQKMEDIPKMLEAGDIFIYWPQNFSQNLCPVIYAMACGSVVVAPNLDVEINAYYQFQDQKNCIFAPDAHTALEQIAILLSQTKLLSNIAQNALEHAQLFSLEQVGSMLGSALTPTIRDPNNYPKKVRVFGFEI